MLIHSRQYEKAELQCTAWGPGSLMIQTAAVSIAQSCSVKHEGGTVQQFVARGGFQTLISAISRAPNL